VLVFTVSAVRHTRRLYVADPLPVRSGEERAA